MDGTGGNTVGKIAYHVRPSLTLFQAQEHEETPRARNSLSPQAVVSDFEEFSKIIFEKLPALCAWIAVLFVVYTVFNAVELPAHAVWPAVAHDLLLVLMFAAASYHLRRHQIGPRWAHPLAATVVLLVLSNIVLKVLLVGRVSYYSTYVLVIDIGAGLLLLSTRWVRSMLVLIYAVWAATIWHLTDHTEFVRLSFTIFAASMVTVGLNLGRQVSCRRILELRRTDEGHKQQLRDALWQTERARDELDQRVWERTCQLEGANNMLAAEVTQRKQAESELWLAAQVFNFSTSAIMILAPDERIIVVNRAFTHITGYAQEDVVGQTPAILLSERHDAQFLGQMQETLLETGHWQGEI
jgi:PAS domain-containing protein